MKHQTRPSQVEVKLERASTSSWSHPRRASKTVAQRPWNRAQSLTAVARPPPRHRGRLAAVSPTSVHHYRLPPPLYHAHHAGMVLPGCPWDQRDACLRPGEWSCHCRRCWCAIVALGNPAEVPRPHRGHRSTDFGAIEMPFHGTHCLVQAPADPPSTLLYYWPLPCMNAGVGGGVTAPCRAALRYLGLPRAKAGVVTSCDLGRSGGGHKVM